MAAEASAAALLLALLLLSGHAKTSTLCKAFKAACRAQSRFEAAVGLCSSACPAQKNCRAFHVQTRANSSFDWMKAVFPHTLMTSGRSHYPQLSPWSCVAGMRTLSKATAPSSTYGEPPSAARELPAQLMTGPVICTSLLSRRVKYACQWSLLCNGAQHLQQSPAA